MIVYVVSACFRSAIYGDVLKSCNLVQLIAPEQLKKAFRFQWRLLGLIISRWLSGDINPKHVHNRSLI